MRLAAAFTLGALAGVTGFVALAYEAIWRAVEGSLGSALGADDR